MVTGLHPDAWGCPIPKYPLEASQLLQKGLQGHGAREAADTLGETGASACHLPAFPTSWAVEGPEPEGCHGKDRPLPSGNKQFLTNHSRWGCMGREGLRCLARPGLQVPVLTRLSRPGSVCPWTMWVSLLEGCPSPRVTGCNALHVGRWSQEIKLSFCSRNGFLGHRLPTASRSISSIRLT